MIREPYIGMPIQIGCTPGSMPGRPVPPPQRPVSPAPAPPAPAPMPDENPTCAPVSGFDTQLLGALPAAMAYVPMQQWRSAYPPAEAFVNGTLFPELNLPFEGGRRR